MLNALNITSNIAPLLKQDHTHIFHDTMSLVGSNLLSFYDATGVSSIESENINLKVFPLNQAQFNYINFNRTLVSIPPSSFKSLN